eukprot:6197488-Pleurochrysis_carterae.AAC.2
MPESLIPASACALVAELQATKSPFTVPSRRARSLSLRRTDAVLKQLGCVLRLRLHNLPQNRTSGVEQVGERVVGRLRTRREGRKQRSVFSHSRDACREHDTFAHMIWTARISCVFRHCTKNMMCYYTQKAHREDDLRHKHRVHGEHVVRCTK